MESQQAAGAPVPVAVLLERVEEFRNGTGGLTARDLTDWLVGQGLAVRAGRSYVRPTWKAVDLVDAINGRPS